MPPMVFMLAVTHEAAAVMVVVAVAMAVTERHMPHHTTIAAVDRAIAMHV